MCRAGDRGGAHGGPGAHDAGRHEALRAPPAAGAGAGERGHPAQQA